MPSLDTLLRWGPATWRGPARAGGGRARARRGPRGRAPPRPAPWPACGASGASGRVQAGRGVTPHVTRSTPRTVYTLYITRVTCVMSPRPPSDVRPGHGAADPVHAGAGAARRCGVRGQVLPAGGPGEDTCPTARVSTRLVCSARRAAARWTASGQRGRGSRAASRAGRGGGGWPGARSV